MVTLKLKVFQALTKGFESRRFKSFVFKPKRLRSDIPLEQRQTANEHKHFVEQLHQMTSHTCR